VEGFLRRPIGLAVFAATIAGIIMLFVAIDGGRDSVFRSDADLFRRVAIDPFGDGSSIDDPVRYGDAYRYGRILYPLTAWVLGAGQDDAVEVALVVLTVVAFGAVIGLSAEHLRRRGRPPDGALLVMLTPGLWLGALATFSEPFVLALLLLALLFELEDRRVAASVGFAATLLAREAMVVALVPAFVRDLRERGAVAVARFAAIGAPLVLWWIWVWVRVGELPFLDDTISRRDALAFPLTGFLDVDTAGFADASSSSRRWMIVVVGLLTVAAAVYVAWRSTWPLVPWVCLALALVILFYGPQVWRFAGEAVRTMAYPQALLLLVAADLRAARIGEQPAGSSPPAV
jgi:hypothetical protein